MNSAEIVRLVVASAISALASATITALVITNRFATRLAILETTLDLKFAEVYRRLGDSE